MAPMGLTGPMEEIELLGSGVLKEDGATYYDAYKIVKYNLSFSVGKLC